MFFRKNYSNNIISYILNIKFNPYFTNIEEFNNSLVFKSLLCENFVKLLNDKEIKFNSDNYEITVKKDSSELSIKTNNINKINEVLLIFEKNISISEDIINSKICIVLEFFFNTIHDFKPLLFNDEILKDFSAADATLRYEDITFRISDATKGEEEDEEKGIFFRLNTNFFDYESNFSIYSEIDSILIKFKKFIKDINLDL